MMFKLFVLLSIVLNLILFNHARAQDGYDSYFLYTTNAQGADYPHNGTPSWGDEDFLTNGIAHDADNWYIVSLETDWDGQPNNDWVIWRIPVHEPLDQDFDGNQSVLTFRKSDFAPLNIYGHAGDIDCLIHDGTDYLIVPLTGGPHPAIAFFSADNLDYVNYAYLPGQFDVGWCAAHPDGRIYSSNDATGEILAYSVDWDSLFQSQAHNALSPAGSYSLRNPDGSTLILENMQGGEFTPDGSRLYVSCGIFVSTTNSDGLHVFETAGGEWNRVLRSFNQGIHYVCCPPYFIYAYDPSLSGGDEPEGLTIWDLDDGRAPNIWGQLHVLLQIHNYAPFHSNAIKLKHYSRTIFVDHAAPPPTPKDQADPFPLHGSRFEPFNTLGDAYGWYPAWDGAEILIKAGSYPETGVFSRRVKISAQGGTVVLGQ